MPRYVEVVVHAPKVQGTFHYHLPPELPEVPVGQLVEVPFGAQRLYGVVTAAVESPAVPTTRPVLAVVDSEIVLTPLQIAFARRLAAETLAPLASCIALMLPPGVAQQGDTRYTLTAQAPDPDAPDLTPQERRLLRLLHRRGPLRGRQLDRYTPRHLWQPILERWRRRGWVTAQPVLLPPRVRPQRTTTVRLAVSPEKALAHRPNLSRHPAVRARRQALLDLLLAEGKPLDLAWALAQTGARRDDIKALERLGLVTREATPTWRDPLAALTLPSPDTPPPLTQDQRTAWEAIRPAIHRAAAGEQLAPFLLHGVTGSGKTELYLHAVAETLALGRQAVVLVPEIALTPQTVERFLARFPGQVGVYHSALSPGERYDTWRRLRRGDLRVLIGPRSALFAPFADLGLIVVDECHDDAYYQQESPPHYHAARAAEWYAALSHAVCLLGSATPDGVTYYRAQRGELTYLRLPQRILAHREQIAHWEQVLTLKSGPTPSGSGQHRTSGESTAPGGRFHPTEGDAWSAHLPPVEIVDMRAELRAGHYGIFSRPLLEALEATLRRGEQAILFVNRRGAATHVFCRDCGAMLTCPRCEVPLTLHRSRGDLLCHHCGYTRRMPRTCPVCGGKRIRGYGLGTERVEEEVQRLFPQARTLRWDADSVRGKAGHSIILHHFRRREADLLIGTQMLAKGIDLPFVTLVGVVLADVGLGLPDYRAAERVFAVLTQVAGRAGRSPLGGRVILQTYQPEHYAIRAAAQHDVAGFYAAEFAWRQRLGYPPFARLVRLLYRHPKAQRAEDEAQRVAGLLAQRLRQGGFRATQMVGPTPCFFARERGYFRWHIVLRGPDPRPLVRGLALGDGWTVQVDPPSLL